MKNTHDIFEAVSAAEDADSPAEPDMEAVLDDEDGSSLGGTTLQLGPRSPLVSSDDSEDEPMEPSGEIPSVPPMPTDSESSAEEEEEFAGDSQRPGAWQSNAYLHYNALDKAKVVVPVQVLYEWVIDGKPSGADFQGTFNGKDLQYLTSILRHTFFYSAMLYALIAVKNRFRFEIWKFKLYPLSYI